MSMINSEGRFQSDKHPELPPDKIILSFHGAAERKALLVFANHCEDDELARDVRFRCVALLTPNDFLVEMRAPVTDHERSLTERLDRAYEALRWFRDAFPPGAWKADEALPKTVAVNVSARAGATGG